MLFIRDQKLGGNKERANVGTPDHIYFPQILIVSKTYSNVQ